MGVGQRVAPISLDSHGMDNFGGGHHHGRVPQLGSTISGWWYTYPSEKYESVGMMKFPVYGKYKSSKPPIRILSSHLLKCELTKFIGHFHQEKQCDQEKGGQNLRNIGLSEKNGNPNLTMVYSCFYP